MATKSLPFIVQGTGLAEFPWRIAATETDQTISRHKSLKTAVRTAECLNLERMVMPAAVHAERENFLASDIRGTCQNWYQYSSSDPASGEECNRPASITDLESGASFCTHCWKEKQ